MSILATYTKQPVELKDYDIDWSDWLEGDTIATRTVATDAGISIPASAITNSNTTVKVWVSGGTDGTKYKVTVTITTAAGRTAQEEFYVKVKES